jgi:Flp pilus assembly protein TadD
MITSSTGANAPSDAAVLEAAAIQASKAGKDDEAVRLWNLLLELQPQHTLALTTLGKRAFRLGDHASARRAFERLVRSEQDNPQHWVNLAMACQGQRDEKPRSWPSTMRWWPIRTIWWRCCCAPIC